MVGFSVFLGEDLTNDTIRYIKQMKAANFKGMFTSLHIPEEDASQYLPRIQALGALAQSLDLTLMVDISAKALEAIGVDLSLDVAPLKAMGISGIRMDYGISMELIAAVSKVMTVGLNASTLKQEDIQALTSYGADFRQMELWHNYYPRVETGLSKALLIERNQWLKAQGFKVIAFVPGDQTLRGPLHAGLPTLEKQRYSHPLAAALELIQDCQIEEVYIGDEQIAETTIDSFKAYFQEQRLTIRVTPLSQASKALYLGCHTNRVDSGQQVIRSQEARFKVLPAIRQENIIPRLVGSVTLDNQLYGRYQGELQIVKTDLPADARVNVVATVWPLDRELIEWIKPGQAYCLRSPLN